MDRITFSTTAEIKDNVLEGIAHVFGQRTLMGNKWVEFARGAFDEALRHSDARAFWNHDTNLLLGRQSSGTLRLSADAEGLKFSIDLPDTSYVNDMKVLIARGDLKEMSFGVQPGKHRLGRAPDNKQVMTHTSVAELFDVSPVSLPAFGETQIQLHSEQEAESIKSQLIKARARVRAGENK
jgi:HK97 family phage prohead protease